jgi:ABC-type transport system involved in cytochrome c biogenesis permease component
MTQVIFWGVNLGLAVFAVGLIVDTAEIKRIGAPVMGVTLLLALGLLASRLWSGTPETGELEST